MIEWKIAHTTDDGRSRWVAQEGRVELNVFEWVGNCTWYVAPGWKITPVRGEAKTVDEAKAAAEQALARLKTPETETP